MRTYVADIIQRIQGYSKKLDDLALLTNQHWVVLDELSNSKTVYIFRENGELLISINGRVDRAKWEYLGSESILIDLGKEAYLFRHGFFDKNILALKMDSKEEYAILINESKFNGELNNINSVLLFLNQNYIANPPGIQIPDIKELSETTEITFKKKGFTFKMGSFREYKAGLNNGKFINIYERISDGKYFIYEGNEIILFSNKEMCIQYIGGRI